MAIASSGITGSIGKHLQNVYPLRARLGDEVSVIERDFRSLNSEVYVHLAALTDTSEAYRLKERSEDLNVTGALRVMEAFAKCGGSRFIFASSSHVYGTTKQGMESIETDIPMPLSLYGIHKLAAEQQLSEMAYDYNIELVIARIFSVFGPNMAKHYLASKVYDAIELPIESQEYPFITNGQDVRDFLSPLEVAETLIRLAKIQTLNSNIEIVNICSGKGLSFREKVLEIVPSWPANRIEQSNSNNPYLVGSANKLKHMFINKKI